MAVDNSMDKDAAGRDPPPHPSACERPGAAQIGGGAQKRTDYFGDRAGGDKVRLLKLREAVLHPRSLTLNNSPAAAPRHFRLTDVYRNAVHQIQE